MIAMAWPELMPGAGVAVDLGRGIHVVVVDDGRARCRCVTLTSVRSGTRSPVALRTSSVADVLDLQPVARVGLHVHLPVAVLEA